MVDLTTIYYSSLIVYGCFNLAPHGVHYFSRASGFTKCLALVRDVHLMSSSYDFFVAGGKWPWDIWIWQNHWSYRYPTVLHVFDYPLFFYCQLSDKIRIMRRCTKMAIKYKNLILIFCSIMRWGWLRMRGIIMNSNTSLFSVKGLEHPQSRCHSEKNMIDWYQMHAFDPALMEGK